MRKLVIGSLLLATVVAAGAISAYINKPWEGPSIQTIFYDFKVAVALRVLDTISVPEMVGEREVRKVLKDRSGGLYAARKVMYDTYLCRPVLGDQHDDYDEVAKKSSKCFAVLYSANGSSAEFWYAKQGLDVQLAPAFGAVRQAIMEKLRSYLQDPVNLRSFYEARKSIVLAHVRSLPQDERQHIEAWLEGVRDTFGAFHQDDVQEGYRLLLKSEHAWLTQDPKQDDNLRAYKIWTAANDYLAGLIPDLNMAKFAGRRHAEGGEALVKEYAAITRDFLTELRSN